MKDIGELEFDYDNVGKLKKVINMKKFFKNILKSETVIEILGIILTIFLLPFLGDSAEVGAPILLIILMTTGMFIYSICKKKYKGSIAIFFILIANIFIFIGLIKDSILIVILGGVAVTVFQLYQ